MSEPFDIQPLRSEDLQGWTDERHLVSEGILWENGWWVDYDVVVNLFGESERCRHCYEDHGSVVCPRVVVAENEGGHNSTGVCLDCILEASRQLPPVPTSRCASHYPHGEHYERTRCARPRDHSGKHRNRWKEW